MFYKILKVTADFEGFRDLESFVRKGEFPGCNSDKLLIIVSEFFENVVEHTERIRGNRLVFRFFCRNSPGILISYNSSFGFYTGKFSRNGVYFKEVSGRFGGIGTLIIKNLVRNVFYLFLFCKRFIFVII